MITAQKTPCLASLDHPLNSIFNYGAITMILGYMWKPGLLTECSVSLRNGQHLAKS